MQAPIHLREPERLAALVLLNPQPSEALDDLVERVCDLLQVPIGLVSVVDDIDQRFVASHGISVASTPREYSFCAWAVHDGEVLEVPDAHADSRFASNPLVVGSPFICSYTGVPLRTADGLPLGTLCVVDRRPRVLSPTEMGILTSFARHVESHLRLEQAQRRLLRREDELAVQLDAHQRAVNGHHAQGRALAHDVRNMTQVQRLLIEETEMLCRGAGAAVDEVIRDLSGSCTRLEGVATAMSTSTPPLPLSITTFNLLEMVREAAENLGPAGHSASVLAASVSVEGDRGLIMSAVQHLLSRAVGAGGSITVMDVQEPEGWGLVIRCVAADWEAPLPAFCAAVLAAHNGEAFVEDGGGVLRLSFGAPAKD